MLNRYKILNCVQSFIISVGGLNSQNDLRNFKNLRHALIRIQDTELCLPEREEDIEIIVSFEN